MNGQAADTYAMAANAMPSRYLLTFKAYGVPGPQGSKTPTGRMRRTKGGGLTPVMRESSKKVKPFREAVAEAGTAAVLQHPNRPWFPLDGPLVGFAWFTVPAPARKKADEAPAADRMPDLSKYLRATEDALKGIVLFDDARIIGYDDLWKTYPLIGPYSLDRPGVLFGVRRATHADLYLDPQSKDGLKYQRLLDRWATITSADRRAAILKAFLG